MTFKKVRLRVPLKCKICKKKEVYKIHSDDLETKGSVRCYFCKREILIVEKKGMILGKHG